MVRPSRGSSAGDNEADGLVYTAVRSRLAFPPSPTSLKTFDPAKEPPPSRARRFQKRRDDKENQNRVLTIYGTSPSKTIRSTSYSNSEADLAPPSLRLPLLEKGVQSGNQSYHHRDVVSNDKPVKRIPQGRRDPSPRSPALRSEPKTDLLEQQQPSKLNDPVNEVEPLPEKNSIASLQAKETSEKKGNQGGKKRKETPTSLTASKQIIEVVVNSSPARTRKVHSSPVKLHQPDKGDNIQTSPEKKRKLQSTVESDSPIQPDQQTVNKKNASEQLNKKVENPEETRAKVIADSSPSRKRPRSKESKKSSSPSPEAVVQVAEKIRQISTDVAKADVMHPLADPSVVHSKKTPVQNQMEEDPLTKASAKKLDGRIVMEAADDTIFSFIHDDDDQAMLDPVPPSSPRRFAEWKKDAPATSEADDLEYIDPAQYSEHRLEEDQRGISGAIDNGRLGAEKGSATLPLPGKKGKEVTPKPAANISSRAPTPPMHSTPLKHKSQQITSLSIQQRVLSAEEERRIKGLETIYGVGLEDESDYEPELLSVRRARRSGSLEAESSKSNVQSKDKIKSTELLKKNSKAVKTNLREVGGGVKTASKEKTPARALEKAKKLDEPTLLDKKKLNEKPAANHSLNVNLGREHSKTPADYFGFGSSSQILQKLLTQKSMRKQAGQLQPIKEKEVESQTQEDGQFTVTKEPEAGKTTAMSMADREDSPPDVDFARLRKITQEATIKVRSEEQLKSEAQLSSELTELDSDLEDDVLKKVAKTMKGARNKKKAPAMMVEEESDRPKTGAEILALMHDTTEGAKAGKSMAQGTRGKKKTPTATKATLEMQIDDDEVDRVPVKTPKPRKGKTLAMTEDDAGQVKRSNTRATKADASKELDEYDVPPGMTLNEVAKNKSKTSKSPTGLKAASNVRSATPIRTATTKDSARPKPKPRPVKKPTDEVDWDTLPGVTGPKRSTPKWVAKTRISQVNQEDEMVAEEVETQPIVKAGTKKVGKRKNLAQESDAEAEVSRKIPLLYM